MTIRVRLFAIMAQQAGIGEFSLTVPPGASVRAAVDEVRRRFSAVAWPASTMVAVNQEYADPDRTLHDGDELAIIPPVSGGMDS